MLKYAVVLLLLMAACIAPKAQAVSYTIDGSIADWNVQLETFSWHSRSHHHHVSGVAFVQSSFTPDPIGTIKFRVEDYWLSDSKPQGGEYYDYEAAYLDTSPGWIYVGIIASHPWDPALTTLEVTANGTTVQAEDFNEFASADLGISEKVSGQWYPNYFYEGAISLAQFGNPEPGSPLSVYANCCSPCQPPDHINLCGTTPAVIPEPASISLVGLALTALVGRHWRRRRT